MGYTPDDVVYTVDFSQSKLAGFEMDIRSMSTDEILDLTRLADVFEANQGMTNAQRVKVVDDLLSTFAEKIVSWNLEDRERNPLPVSRESLGKQDLARFVIPVLRMAVDAIVDVDENLGKDSSSSPASRVASIPMEAL